ncbi:MAG: RidA family protein [Phycisphaeraceae bacterium]
MAQLQTLRLEKESVPLAKAVIHNGVAYLSGQAALDPETRRATSPDIKEQTRETLRRLENILKEAGTSKDKLLMVRVYLRDVANDFDAMNEVYLDWLEGHRPARTTVGAPMAINDLKVEIDCMAAVD